MAYTQPVVRGLLSPVDTPNRKVLLALEIIDPIAQSLVSRGVTVRAKGLKCEPIVSLSGRFVWLEEEEGDKWPEEISVVPFRLPFASEVLTPPRPADLSKVKPADRLVRLTLRPGPAYEFSGVTAIRGRIFERLEPPEPPSPGVTDAQVQLAWFDLDTGDWIPKNPSSLEHTDTNKKGEFAAFLRLAPGPLQHPDLLQGMLKVRLQVTRGRTDPETRVTPDDFEFLPENQAPKGRIAESRLLTRDLKLGWAELDSIFKL